MTHPVPNSFIEVNRPNGKRTYQFHDCYDDLCVIQESSHADKDAIWLGNPDHAMLIDQSKAQDLVYILQDFIKNGELPKPNRKVK